MNAAVLDPILGPISTATDLFAISKKALEESLEYQDFVQSLNEKLSKAAQSGEFYIVLKVPRRFYTVLYLHYSRSTANISVSAYPTEGEGDMFRVEFSWSHAYN